MNPHQTRLDAEKETFDPALTAKADICRIPRAITPRKQCKGVLTYERRNQLLADPISAPPRRRPVGTKTAKNPSGGKGRRGLGQRTPGSGILDRAVLALERMKENGKGKKRKVATIPDQAKPMGSGATEARGRRESNDGREGECEADGGCDVDGGLLTATAQGDGSRS